MKWHIMVALLPSLMLTLVLGSNTEFVDIEGPVGELLFINNKFSIGRPNDLQSLFEIDKIAPLRSLAVQIPPFYKVNKDEFTVVIDMKLTAFNSTSSKGRFRPWWTIPYKVILKPNQVMIVTDQRLLTTHADKRCGQPINEKSSFILKNWNIEG